MMPAFSKLELVFMASYPPAMPVPQRQTGVVSKKSLTTAWLAAAKKSRVSGCAHDVQEDDPEQCRLASAGKVVDHRDGPSAVLQETLLAPEFDVHVRTPCVYCRTNRQSDWNMGTRQTRGFHWASHLGHSDKSSLKIRHS